MSVTVTYRCNGCEAVAESRGLISRLEVVLPAAVTVGGVPYDRCHRDTPSIESAAPEGWMPFDPYTGVCYCPDCWAGIEANVSAAA